MSYNSAMDMEEMTHAQERICDKYDAAFRKPDIDKTVGVASNLNSTTPLNGLRHPATDDTEGWYFWAGELSSDKDFFKPMHLKHLIELHPELAPYLGLPPGWRFIIDPSKGYEDVWRDDSLLRID